MKYLLELKASLENVIMETYAKEMNKELQKENECLNAQLQRALQTLGEYQKKEVQNIK